MKNASVVVHLVVTVLSAAAVATNAFGVLPASFLSLPAIITVYTTTGMVMLLAHDYRLTVRREVKRAMRPAPQARPAAEPAAPRTAPAWTSRTLSA
jgi:hypothetical protein